MSKGQDQESRRNAVLNKAVAFAYDNISDLKKQRVVINVQNCSAKLIVRRQRTMGPGETIDTVLLNEEWEVSIPLKVFSSILIITLYRNNDGSLDVTDFTSRPL